MFKVVIFCGGTGSTALQNGFDEIYGSDHICLDLIVNAYDNGKSTGVCRRVFGNQILGPSDVRKNQLLQFSLQHRQELLAGEARFKKLYQLFEMRLSAPDAPSYYAQARRIIGDFADMLNPDIYRRLLLLLEFFFFETDGVPRLSTLDERFEDFALSNIFYAASAALNGNSLQAAAEEMAEILDIKDNVHLISDKSLLLKAETASGRVIDDEGKIVAWDDPADKIVRAMLFSGEQEYVPHVGEGLLEREWSIRQIVSEADLIIFSSGTQWSSLIPTYMHCGFAKMISQSKAKKYLVMNNVEDHDAVGVDACALCEILERYLNLHEMTIVINQNAADAMKNVPDNYRTIRDELGEADSPKHDPKKLVEAIMIDYYGRALDRRHQFFDLDGTLWNASGGIPEIAIGRENLEIFDGAIITGNTREHVLDIWEQYAPAGKTVEVYADYGNTHFMSDEPDRIDYLSDGYFLDSTVYQTITEAKSFKNKVKLRGQTVISIKPIENRERIVEELNQKLMRCDRPVLARIAGKTTIDIAYADYTKAAILELLLAQQEVLRSDVLFVGNELEQGSEKEITGLGVETLAVNDVFECNVFLRTKRAMREAKHDG